MTEADPVHAPVRLPERSIPVPSSISPAAQAMLSASATPPAGMPGFPEPDDRDGWTRWIAAASAGMEALDLGQAFEALVDAEAIRLGPVPAFRVTPRVPDDGGPPEILFDIHGGALIVGGGAACRATAVRAAGTIGGVVYSPDYRMPPEHPFPTPLDDCQAAYLALAAQYAPDRIVVSGSSAGGNLACALMLRLRTAGLPFPAGLILQSPEVDLTESGDSFRTNEGIDVVLRRGLLPVNRLYANGRDLADPELSPLFASFEPGFPPTVITTGTRDLFLSNAVRLHNTLRRAHIPSDLLIVEAMPHGGFGDAPEDQELAAELRAFARRCWGSAG